MNKNLSPFWTLFILTGLNILNYTDRYVLSAVITPLKNEFDLTDAQIGRLATAFMIGYFISSPFFGYLGDRLPRKWLIASGVFVWSIATVLTGFATGFFVLIVFRVLVGFGEASYGTISPGILSDVFEPKKRNSAITIFYSAIPVGAALGFFIGGIISEQYSWREAFIFAGAPGLFLALVLLPFKEPLRGEADGRTAYKKPGIKDAVKLFRIKQYCLVVAGYSAYTFAMGAFAYWGPAFLHRMHDISNEKAALFFGTGLVLAGLFGTLAGGAIATAWKKRNPAGYSLLLGISMFIAVPVTFIALLTPDTSVSITALVIAMFFLFFITGPVNTMILESVPANLRSNAMALSIFTIHLFGDMWSPEIIGRLSDRWDSLEKAVLVLPFFLLAAAVLWLLTGARKKEINSGTAHCL